MRAGAWLTLSFVSAGAIIAVGACTVFDGLSVPVDDASAEAGEASLPDGGPSPEAGPPGYLSIDDGVKFCANAFKCPFLPSSTINSLGVPVDALHFSGCVNWVSGPIPQDRIGLNKQAQWLKCAGDAKTCAQAGSCMWWEIIDPKDARCSGPVGDAGSVGACAEDGGAAYYCKDGIIAHCSHPGYAPGSTCMVAQNQDRRCAVAKGCSQADSCMSTYELYCSTGNLYEGLDCQITGYTCGIDPMGGLIQCLTEGQYKTCSNIAVTCDQNGAIVSVCDGAQINEYKCTSLQGTCDNSGGTPRCKIPGESCSPYDKDEDQCTGTSISMCIGGRKLSYDCAKAGLTCQPAAGAVSAHCG
jgi:hypothetical protein